MPKAPPKRVTRPDSKASKATFCARSAFFHWKVFRRKWSSRFPEPWGLGLHQDKEFDIGLLRRARRRQCSSGHAAGVGLRPLESKQRSAADATTSGAIPVPLRRCPNEGYHLSSQNVPGFGCPANSNTRHQCRCITTHWSADQTSRQHQLRLFRAEVAFPGS